MKRLLVLVAALALSLGALTTVLAGSASAATGYITNPRGVEVPTGLRSFTVNLSEGGAFTYTVESDDGVYWEYGSVEESSPGELTIPIPPVNHVGAYTILLENVDGYVFDMTPFDVVAPPRLTSPTASPSTFFPVVRDGYRDSATFSFRTNTRLKAIEYAVRDSAYKVVTRQRVGVRNTGVVKWAWNGRNASGRTLPTGTYTILATALTTDGQVLTAVSPRITSRTTTVRKRVQAVRTGAETSSLVGTGDCHVTPYEYDGSLDLDCWDFDTGSYARARYQFTVPSTATNLVWRVNGETHCCDRGIIRKTGERLSATRYRVEVYVTDYRAYQVDSVTLTYTTTVKR